MGLDLTTFVLEILNFGVLLWLLNRFLFRPIQAAIARRQAEAEAAQAGLDARAKALADAEAELAARRAAEADEREAARAALGEEMLKERGKRLQALDAEIAQARAQAEARLAAQQESQRRQCEADATARAEGFVRHYLERLAGPALEQAIIALFLSDLGQIDPEKRRALAAAVVDGPVLLETVYPVSTAVESALADALASLLDHPVSLRWQATPELIAGLRVELDGHRLEASLAAGLRAFTGNGEST